MGNKTGASWLTIVKRAFRSPTKDNGKRIGRTRDDHEQEEEEKKRGKRRWLFRKQANHVEHCVTKRVNPISAAEHRHAIAVAAATAAAAEAAVATAQAAMEIVRLTRPSTFITENHAAIVIQTAFRGYLARRAHNALKGIVKLQAFVRGHNVRKQTKITLKYMQSLGRIQDQVDYQCARISHEMRRKSMFAEANSVWESRYLQDIRERKSVSKDASFLSDSWDDCTNAYTFDEMESMLQRQREASLKREKALAYALSHQVRRSRRNSSAGNEIDLEDRSKWLDRWMATKQWESRSRSSTDNRDHIKNVEIDTSRPYSYSAPNVRGSQHNQTQKQFSPHSGASPLRRGHFGPPVYQPPATPSPCKIKPLQTHSASPRYPKQEQCYSAAHTPSFGSSFGIRGAMSSTVIAAIPNYMAATESAKARARSQSAPRQRPSTPERERGGSAKKRLSYPVPEQYNNVETGCKGFSQNLRSPSFKSLPADHFVMEQHSNISSCYTDSLGSEISPSSQLP